MSASDLDGVPGSTVAQEEAPKRPLIRKGQRKPYVKGTRKQIELRLEAAALLKSCGFSKCQMHRVFRERYGVEWRQTERYMARARACETPT
jgi:methylphosphotriester-DNA--protein-cysteine methyltransferase